MFALASMGHTFLIITPFMYRLTQKHDGIYLAQVTSACLRRFGLEKFVCLYFLFFSPSLVCNLIYIFIATFAMHG